MVNRLREFREARGLARAALAELIGSGASTITKIERGERDLTVDMAKRVAPHLDCSSADLEPEGLAQFMEGATLQGQHLHRPKGVTVIDYVEAGDWRETSGFAFEDQYKVPVFDDRYKPEDLFGIEVRGDSMDEKYDEGTILICRKFDPMVELPPVGKDVIVRRRSAEGLIERTVKSLETDEHGRGWLVPKSKNDAWQSEEFSQKGDGDELDIDTEIIGVVLWDMRRH